MFIGHRSQGLARNKSPSQTPLAPVDPTAHKPAAQPHLRSHSPFLHRPVLRGIRHIPYEQTLDQDDTRLSILEERAGVHSKPLDEA